MSTESRLMLELAEFALEADSRTEFRRLSMDCLGKTICADWGTISSTTDGLNIVADPWNDDASRRLLARLPHYMAQLTPDELHRSLDRAVNDNEIFTERRKSSLAMYDEHLFPQHVRGYAVRMSFAHGRCHWIVLGRAGRAPQFEHEALGLLDRAFQVLLVGECLHHLARVGTTSSERLRDYRLTPSELRVAEFVQRGLTNREVAVALGVSINTVRNQLASVFSKLQVSTRAEMLFVISHGDAAAQAAPAVVLGGGMRRFIQSVTPRSNG